MVFPKLILRKMMLIDRGSIQSIPLALSVCQSTPNWLQSVLKYANCATRRATRKKDLPLRLGWTVATSGVSNAEKECSRVESCSNRDGTACRGGRAVPVSEFPSGTSLALQGVYC